MPNTRNDKAQLRKTLQNFMIDCPEYEKSPIRFCGWRGGSDFAVHEKIYLNESGMQRGIYFTGRITCGTIFCPVCSGIIKTYRAFELNLLCSSWQGNIYMLTFTISHHKRDRLAYLFDILKNAYRKFWNNDATKKTLGSLGGTVRSLEVTHGDNGWHPHFHTLLFVSESFVFSEESIRKLKHIWVRMVSKAGGSADPGIGLFVKLGDNKAADYICKLGSELNGQECKDSCGFQQLLVDRKKSLVQEYLVALKGVHWLKWSKGLRARLSLPDLADSEIFQLVKKKQLNISQGTLNFLQDVFFNFDTDGKLRDYLTDLLKMQHTLKRWCDQPKIQALFDAYCDWQLSKNSRFVPPDPDQFHRDMAKLGFEFDFCGIAPNKGG